MKLRLETGNFDIVLDASGEAEIAKDLLPEQFIGAVVVNNSGDMFAVTKVSVSNGVYTLVIDGGTVAYTKATGAVAYTAAQS